MKQSVQGSALLTIFLILSSLTLLCCVVWRTATLTFDVAITKQEFEAYYQKTAAFLKHGSELCKNNFTSVQTYLKKHRDLVLALPASGNSDREKKQQCIVKIQSINEDTLALMAKLQEDGRQLYVLSCIVARTKISNTDAHDASTDYFAVASWKKNGCIHNG
jgi:hypothetical protein